MVALEASRRARCGRRDGSWMRAIARIRNQNSGPATAIIAEAEQHGDHVRGHEQAERRPQQRDPEQRLEAEHGPVAAAPHADRGGEHQAREDDDADGRRLLPAHLPAGGEQHEVEHGERGGEQRGERHRERALARRERLQARAQRVVARAAAGVAARHAVRAAAYGCAVPTGTSSAAPQRARRRLGIGRRRRSPARRRCASRRAPSPPPTLPASRPPIANHGVVTCAAAQAT